MTTAAVPTTRPLDRLLRLFTDVKDGEGLTAILLASNIFLLLMAYYVLKPVREALILSSPGGAELKSYMSAFQVGVLLLVVPAYGKLVAMMNRRALINTVTAFFVACLGVFYVLGKAGVPLGVPFFLWIGIFNLMIIAQFWAFANDVYTKDEGERLFPVVGFGASLGAVFGSKLAGPFISSVGVLELMLVGALLLVIQVLVTNYVDYRERERVRASRGAPKAAPAKTGSSKGAFNMVFSTRYLLSIALMLMLLNWVNTTGEYILGSIVRDNAVAQVGSQGSDAVGASIGEFYSTYFTYVNILGLLLQMFVVSRIIRYFGVGISVLVLPIISLTSYSMIVVYPLLQAVFAAKVAENSTDYSLNNTVRNILFLPCTTEQKYSAKQAIDSFFVRLGDVLSALLVFVGAGAGLFHIGARGFALVNACLVVVWLLLAWRTGRTYTQLTASGQAPA
jgi:AAA family ATP:ADP antiporter